MKEIAKIDTDTALVCASQRLLFFFFDIPQGEKLADKVETPEKQLVAERK